VPPSFELQGLVFERQASATATGASDHKWSDDVLAVLQGERELSATLDGIVPNRPRGTKGSGVEPAASETTTVGAAVREGPGVYSQSVSVTGFRGIGATTTLTLRPGPGLTIVTGRNGTGKSSFAEGLEFLLTGQSYRWMNRTKEWCEGWRNLHQPHPVLLTADLVVEGKGSLAVRREWTAREADTLDATQTVVYPKLQAPGQKGKLAQPPSSPCTELGSLLDEGPSKLYDALSLVLGLEEFVTLQERLTNARKACDQVAKQGKEGADALIANVDASSGSVSVTSSPSMTIMTSAAAVRCDRSIWVSLTQYGRAACCVGVRRCRSLGLSRFGLSRRAVRLHFAAQSRRLGS